jgi:hypothetical protein
MRRLLDVALAGGAVDPGGADLGSSHVDADHVGIALGGHARHSAVDCAAVDRRLAQKNLRTAFIAGAICLLVFAAAWVAGFVY